MGDLTKGEVVAPAKCHCCRLPNDRVSADRPAKWAVFVFWAGCGVDGDRLAVDGELVEQ